MCTQKRAGWTGKKIVQAWRGRDDARVAPETQRERARVFGAGKEMYGALERLQAQSMLAAIMVDVTNLCGLALGQAADTVES